MRPDGGATIDGFTTVSFGRGSIATTGARPAPGDVGATTAAAVDVVPAGANPTGATAVGAVEADGRKLPAMVVDAGRVERPASVVACVLGWISGPEWGLSGFTPGDGARIASRLIDGVVGSTETTAVSVGAAPTARTASAITSLGVPAGASATGVGGFASAAAGAVFSSCATGSGAEGAMRTTSGGRVIACSGFSLPASIVVVSLAATTWALVSTRIASPPFAGCRLAGAADLRSSVASRRTTGAGPVCIAAGGTAARGTITALRSARTGWAAARGALRIAAPVSSLAMLISVRAGFFVSGIGIA